MLLGESPFATQIRSDIAAMRIIMVTLFFASVGMQAKPMWFLTHLHWVILVSVVILILKTIIIYGVGRLFKLNHQQALATGITLSQVGEFSFVLAATARNGGVLSTDLVDLIVTVIIVLMLVTPYLVTHADTLASRLFRLVFRRTPWTENPSSSEASETSNKILVIGLGPAGKQVVQTLLTHDLEPVLIDVNPKSRAYAGKHGLRLHIGDAGHEEILMHAGLGDVCMAVVTVPDPRLATHIVKIIRRLRPHVTIAARCRYHRHMPDLLEAGADIIVDGEITVGDKLSHEIIDVLTADVDTLAACRLTGHSGMP
jgi:CPA2 family monovalent cation:H+ antiporter-2